jgi:hypothetical protein
MNNRVMKSYQTYKTLNRKLSILLVLAVISTLSNIFIWPELYTFHKKTNTSQDRNCCQCLNTNKSN